MAMSAYYLKGVQSKNVELMEIFAGIMPFLGLVIFAMVLMYWFPGISFMVARNTFRRLNIIMLDIFSLSTNELVSKMKEGQRFLQLEVCNSLH